VRSPPSSNAISPKISPALRIANDHATVDAVELMRTLPASSAIMLRPGDPLAKIRRPAE
jgi:hypothetical protein